MAVPNIADYFLKRQEADRQAELARQQAENRDSPLEAFGKGLLGVLPGGGAITSAINAAEGRNQVPQSQPSGLLDLIQQMNKKKAADGSGGSAMGDYELSPSVGDTATGWFTGGMA